MGGMISILEIVRDKLNRAVFQNLFNFIENEMLGKGKLFIVKPFLK